MFTAEEIDASVQRATDPDRSYESGWWGLYNGEIKEIELDLGVTAVYVGDKKFGAESMYDDYPIFVVVRVDDHEGQTSQYFQKEGTYSSWEGSDFLGECVEVEPVEVPLTFYRHKE